MSYRVFGKEAKIHHTCPAGNKCTLDSAVEHTMCVCGNEKCWCHSRERYDEEKGIVPMKGRLSAKAIHEPTG